GLLVIVDHGEGYLSLYAHNQLLHKKAGDAVKAGELIASVGNTGGQSQSGLYFEIRHQGRAINPIDWLARA
ncbi:MAG: peptidase M23, partial [Moraxellaceae bacterium]